MAESELMKATAELARNQKALEEQMDLFEKKKLNDIKTVMLEFIKMELAFHSKAVEFFTKAYKDVAQINEEHDLEVSARILSCKRFVNFIIKVTLFFKIAGLSKCIGKCESGKYIQYNVKYMQMKNWFCHFMLF